MATALQLSDNGGDPTYTVSDGGVTPLIEPLGGFPTVDDIMDRFPDEVYDTGKDSHLYRFMQALCGDVGAGQLKKQSYVSRLKDEAVGRVFSEIDTNYSSLRFPRLSFEFPEGFSASGQIDPASSVLTKEEWDAIELGDESYTHRIMKFLESTRLGNSPAGMADAAEAGSGVVCDIWETYRSVFANLHDEAYEPSGGYSLPFIGLTKGTGEFVIMPHVEDENGWRDGDSPVTAAWNASPADDYPQWAGTHAYIEGDIVIPITVPDPDVEHRFVATVAGTSGGSEPTWPTDGTTVTDGGVTWLDVGPASVVDAQTLEFGAFKRLDPERQRNMVHVMDNVRPVGTLMSVQTMEPHYVPIAVDPLVIGSSSNFRLARFVTGKLNVDWPTPDEKVATEDNPDRSRGYFIEAGVENEQKSLPLASREKPVINHTIENVIAYTDDALSDPTYGTSSFKPSNYPDFHTGSFNKTETSIFPALAKIAPTLEFKALKAVAVQNTPLIFESNPKK